jgi:hypothetical protein
MTKFPLIADECIVFLNSGHYGTLSGTGLRLMVTATRRAKNTEIQNAEKKPVISVMSPARNGSMVIPR